LPHLAACQQALTDSPGRAVARRESAGRRLKQNLRRHVDGPMADRHNGYAVPSAGEAAGPVRRRTSRAATARGRAWPRGGASRMRWRGVSNQSLRRHGDACRPLADRRMGYAVPIGG